MSKQGKFSKGRRSHGRKILPLLLALVLLTGTVAGTLAYLLDSTVDVVNTFIPASVPNTPVEEFKNNVKSSITVRVDGNIAAYVRVKLVSYRVDDQGNHIGGTATIPTFTLGENWFAQDGYYYYKLPVQPNGYTSNLLDTSITLQAYTDADGGKQVIEVISESIQSVPTTTVESVWNVKVVNGNLTEGGNA